MFALFGVSHCFKLRPQKSTIFSECVFPLLNVSSVECHIHTAGVLYFLLIAVVICKDKYKGVNIPQLML